MRIAWISSMILVLCLAAGCGGSRQKPLFAGTLEGGTFWKNPLTAPSNEGTEYEKGNRVEVYEQFVVVTTSDGINHLHPHGFYSGLAIKRE